MITKTEVNKAGEKVAVYHQAGTIADRKDEKFIWTHPYDQRAQCVACTDGVIPEDVKAAKP